MAESHTPLSFGVILKGRCPRCGKGKLYKSLLAIADSCNSCGLSFAGHEQGDGPAFFAILIVGGLVAIGAAIVEIKYEPSFWLQAAIWIPFIVIGSIGFLRMAKAALIHVQYSINPQDFD